MPISLADERAPGLALLGAVVPAAAFAIFDYFALRQRRIAKRNALVLFFLPFLLVADLRPVYPCTSFVFL